MTRSILNLVATLILSGSAYASTFTLTNNQTGADYHCSADGNGGGPADPACVSSLRSYCDFETAFSDEDCFTKSTRACGNGVTASCVQEVFRECDFETALTDEQCFDQSLQACGGGSAAIRQLIRSAQQNTKHKLALEAKLRKTAP